MGSLTARKGLLLKADPIAATFKDEVMASLAQCTTRPRLVGILATTSAPSRNYAEFTKKQCEELGVDYVLKLTGAAASPGLGEGEGVEEAIIEANEDESIHGIMVRDMISHVETSLIPMLLLDIESRSTSLFSECNRFVRGNLLDIGTGRLTRRLQDHYLQQVPYYFIRSEASLLI